MTDQRQGISAPLLWVPNRTQNNPRGRSKAEDTAVRKHIQTHLQQTGSKTRQSRRVQTRAKREATSSSSVVVAPIDVERPEGCQCDSPSGSSCPSLSRGSTPDLFASPSQVATPEPVLAVVKSAKDLFIDARGMLLFPFPGGGDPFASAARELIPANLELISHCQNFHVSAAWPRQAGLIDGRAADWNLQVKDAVADPLYLQTLLASGALYRSRLSNDAAAAKRDFLSAQQKAISLLRANVASQKHDKTTVLAIMQMVSLSYQAGFYDEAVTYQQGAKAILQTHSVEDWRPHEMVLVTDLWLSVADMELGPFLPNDFDPGPWSSQGIDRHIDFVPKAPPLPELSSIPEPATTSLRSIFDAINELSEVFDWMHVTRNKEEKSRAAMWLHLRSTATKRRLMTYLIFARQAGKKPAGLLKETLVTAACNAAMCYVNFAFVPTTGPQGLMRAGPLAAYRHILRRAIVEAGLARPGTEEKQLMLWLLFVGLVSEWHFRQDTRAEDVDLFKTRFRALAGDLGCSSWTDLKAILERYLYRAQIMDETLISLMG